MSSSSTNHLDPQLQPIAAHQHHPNFQPPPQQPPQVSPPARKRKKAAESGEDAGSSEPRRLRRSHEACARCRSKKIKASNRRNTPPSCDSKHPRCTSCTTAGTDCHQEDRHRQQLITRGHTERLERQIVLCDALLKRHIPGFDLNNIEEIVKREGVDVAPDAHAQDYQPYVVPAAQRGFPLRPEGQGPFPPPPPPAPYNYMMQYPPPGGFPQMQPIPGYYPYPAPPGPQYPLAPVPAGPVDPTDTKGVDPQSNDMSNITALAKNFGVSSNIIDGLDNNNGIDGEDFSVGSSGLESRRDRHVYNGTPRSQKNWAQYKMSRNSHNSSRSGRISPGPSDIHPSATSVTVWLPNDRRQLMHVVDVYFTRLNFHRPVLERPQFEENINKLYDGITVPDDPGFVCSLYLVLALGTLSDACHRLNQDDGEGNVHNPKSVMPPGWPQADEFFDLALSVKPDLRVTISSLQALILLQWYLYTERQGRTLWRLVGNLVRLSIELGLHHNPALQEATFDTDEAELRIRLWSIVMVHDRGTSILLGRPLAIAPSDSNVPHPERLLNNMNVFSEHFQWSHPVADIQAQIIEALYTPKTQSGGEIMRAATRIIRRMDELKTKSLPESYKWYFTGTADWPMEKRKKLVADITEDQGLTLLKIGISRILLLRALFSSKELDYTQRHEALVDAVTTSHNIIIVHSQLIRYPDIAFFTSPIPLHIAAMVILFGHMSQIDKLSAETARQDVWMALDMLPRFRWRWERKDLNGGHPLIAKLAESVLKMSLSDVSPTRDVFLIPEPDWSPHFSPPQDAQALPPPPPPPPVQYPPPGAPAYGSGGGGNKFVADVPVGAFYPEASAGWMNDPTNNGGQFQEANTQQQLLAAIGRDATYGQQGGYMLEEEKDPGAMLHGVPSNWLQGHGPSGRYPQ